MRNDTPRARKTPTPPARKTPTRSRRPTATFANGQTIADYLREQRQFWGNPHYRPRHTIRPH